MRIWVAVIQYRNDEFGISTTVLAARWGEALFNRVYDHVERQWPQQFPDRQMPDDLVRAIDTYFEEVEGASLFVDTVEVDD